MEYCENGSLGALLDHGGRIEDEVYIVDYAYQLLSGLAYLHENNIVHRDIKPDSKVIFLFILFKLISHLLCI
jgi:mitogen-activated protein kinase kinase kinase